MYFKIEKFYILARLLLLVGPHSVSQLHSLFRLLMFILLSNAIWNLFYNNNVRLGLYLTVEVPAVITE